MRGGNPADHTCTHFYKKCHIYPYFFLSRSVGFVGHPLEGSVAYLAQFASLFSSVGVLLHYYCLLHANVYPLVPFYATCSLNTMKFLLSSLVAFVALFNIVSAEG